MYIKERIKNSLKKYELKCSKMLIALRGLELKLGNLTLIRIGSEDSSFIIFITILKKIRLLLCIIIILLYFFGGSFMTGILLRKGMNFFILGLHFILIAIYSRVIRLYYKYPKRYVHKMIFSKTSDLKLVITLVFFLVNASLASLLSIIFTLIFFRIFFSLSVFYLFNLGAIFIAYFFVNRYRNNYLDRLFKEIKKNEKKII